MGVFLLKMIEQNGDRNILLVAKKFFGRQKKIPAVLLLIHTKKYISIILQDWHVMVHRYLGTCDCDITMFWVNQSKIGIIMTIDHGL